MSNENKSNGEIGMELYEEPKAVAINDHGTAQELEGQVQVIQDAMKLVMAEDEHFGTIPGTNKLTLLKPGAEKLSLLFRLAPEYEVDRYEMKNGHREYEVKCRLTHINSGKFMGAGLGSCSTMEKKYRYRNEDMPTDIPVPKSYWDNKDYKVLLNAIKAKDIGNYQNIGTTKENGQWVISIRKKISNPDIADVYNTVLKMAKKRAHVDAILTATAASDIFTQDLEDMPDMPPQKKKPVKKGNKKKGKDNNSQNKNDKPWLNKTYKDSDELTDQWKKAVKIIRAGKHSAREIIDSYRMKSELKNELKSIEKRSKEPAINGEGSEPDLPY